MDYGVDRRHILALAIGLASCGNSFNTDLENLVTNLSHKSRDLIKRNRLEQNFYKLEWGEGYLNNFKTAVHEEPHYRHQLISAVIDQLDTDVDELGMDSYGKLKLALITMDHSMEFANDEESRENPAEVFATNFDKLVEYVENNDVNYRYRWVAEHIAMHSGKFTNSRLREKYFLASAQIYDDLIERVDVDSTGADKVIARFKGVSDQLKLAASNRSNTPLEIKPSYSFNPATDKFLE